MPPLQRICQIASNNIVAPNSEYINSTSLLKAHRISGLFQQNTDPSVISQS